MTQTSSHTSTSTLSKVEFELAFALRSLEESINLFREGAEFRFAENGVITDEDDREQMMAIFNTLLSYREALSPETLEVLSHPVVESELQEVIDEVDAEMEMERRGEVIDAAFNKVLDEMLASVGIDRSEIESLASAFFLAGVEEGKSANSVR